MRQQIKPRNGREYKMLNKNIRNSGKQTKDEWLNKKYADRDITEHQHGMYKKIKETEQKMCSLPKI